MADLIDRQVAIDSIPEARADIFENCYRCTLLTREEVVEILEGLPSAEERTSEWEYIMPEQVLQRTVIGGLSLLLRYRCKNCGYLSFSESNYCPECGRRMESES